MIRTLPGNPGNIEVVFPLPCVDWAFLKSANFFG